MKNKKLIISGIVLTVFFITSAIIYFDNQKSIKHENVINISDENVEESYGSMVD